MTAFNPFHHVSASPTNPQPPSGPKQFDVPDLYRGPMADVAPSANGRPPLDEKLRQAYFWIVNHAIISPHYDLEYYSGPHQTYKFGDSKTEVNLPSGQSYSSFVLLPLLNFAVRRRCLLMGGPGRVKTSSAILMGVLAGYSVPEVRRAMQHGQPQMTISDLLGRVGAFRGFGGTFIRPPQMSAPGGQFVASDGEQHWLLHADRFGATLHRLAALPTEPPVMAAPLFKVGLGGQVSRGPHSAVFPDLVVSHSSAANTSTLAVTTPLSHAVYLIALVA